ncbi:aminoglycoside phosphotransferase family protein [Kribbella turkmenica]|uniref:Aminoglycoside phosphotransferase family protein n=1 Tax=Kribbella turkmenica TaxID=2530375 RepID=A0A4R4WSU9_9ACTN|nr:phosphotransferase [Kribbella turkmenica]TDD20670.1 aminoglycoside phosphotransferase family protein [Kribbella turkmenica]
MDEEIALQGGNVGGAVRVGDTVRRTTGPWTPAVHALLNYLADAGLAGVPRVHGYDDRGREILDYLPGTAYGPEVPDDVLADAMRWLAEYHRVVASYRPEGELVWRAGRGELAAGQIICMHDYGYYNWIGTEAGFSGVIDWDLAGPGVPLDDLAFSAWNTAPLAIPMDPAYQAARLRLMASAYGDAFTPLQILEGAPDRARRSARVIRAGRQAGDAGMLNLATVGEPERTERRLADLRRRVPEIAALL